MRPTLTIFIDGLPYDQLENMPFAREMASKARLIPSLGYSVNCQTELFTGKSADEIGFWCEWSAEPETSPFRPYGWLFKTMSPIERVWPAKRVIHKVIDRLAPVSYTKNIPLRYLSQFDETGFSVFDPRFSLPSLLDDPAWTNFLYHQFPGGSDRDRLAAKAVLDHIESADDPGPILVTMVGIDHCSHWEGVGSPPYMEMLAENDEFIRDLSNAYLAKVPDGIVFVVSDHGMTNIERTVEIDLESRFGTASPSTYMYFSEATLLRVWVEDEALRARIQEYLDGIDDLEHLTEDEREEMSVTRREFGDLVYHTPVGAQIVPSYWGNKPSVGMHGHHPRYPGQHGLCLSSEEDLFEGSLHALDFYGVLAGFQSTSA